MTIRQRIQASFLSILIGWIGSYLVLAIASSLTGHPRIVVGFSLVFLFLSFISILPCWIFFGLPFVIFVSPTSNFLRSPVLFSGLGMVYGVLNYFIFLNLLGGYPWRTFLYSDVYHRDMEAGVVIYAGLVGLISAGCYSYFLQKRRSKS